MTYGGSLPPIAVLSQTDDRTGDIIGQKSITRVVYENKRAEPLNLEPKRDKHTNGEITDVKITIAVKTTEGELSWPQR